MRAVLSPKCDLDEEFWCCEWVINRQFPPEGGSDRPYIVSLIHFGRGSSNIVNSCSGPMPTHYMAEIVFIKCLENTS